MKKPSRRPQENSSSPSVPPSSTTLGSRAAQRVEQISNHIETSDSRGLAHVVDEMAASSTVRRIVTDHNAEGKAIFGADDLLTPANPIDPQGGPVPEGVLIPGFTSIFRTDGHPASAQGSWTDPHGKMQNLVGGEGVMCRVVDFPPVPEDAPAEVKDLVNLMHRTVSVDFGVVLDGEIDLVLDAEGDEDLWMGDKRLRKKMQKGDIAVQRATNHLWHNRYTQPCRMLFVLVPAKPVIVEATGEALKPTDTTNLEKPKEES